jgi:hypothetical protein
MESLSHLEQEPPPLEDPGEPTFEEEEDDVFMSPEEDLPLGLVDLDAVSISDVLMELSHMTRRDGSSKYTDGELKELGKRLERRDIDLTLIEPNALPYTYETHKLDMQANKAKNKRLKQAISSLLENSCPGFEKNLCHSLISVGWLLSLEDTQCTQPKKKGSLERCSGTYKLANKKALLDGVVWRCRVCDKYQYIRKDAHVFFKMHNKVPIGTLVRVCMAFIVGTPALELSMTLNLRENTIKDIYTTLRYLVIQSYSPTKLGGNQVVVEMDEMYWIRRMRPYGLLRNKLTFLIFGALERNTGKIRLKLLIDRTAETILKETEDMVLEQSIVFTDSYVGYSGLTGRGYDHYHLIKPSYVDQKPGKKETGERKYYKQRLQIKKPPTIEQEMKLDLAEIYRRKTGQNLSAYSSTSGIENVWKYFRKFYRSKGRISCNAVAMMNVITEFEWRHNNKSDIFNAFASLLQPEMTSLLTSLSANRVSEAKRIVKRASAKRSIVRRKMAKEFVRKHLELIKSLIGSILATIKPKTALLDNLVS